MNIWWWKGESLFLHYQWVWQILIPRMGNQSKLQIAHSNIYALPFGFSFSAFLGTETATKISFIGAQTKLFKGFTNTHDCLIILGTNRSFLFCDHYLEQWLKHNFTKLWDVFSGKLHPWLQTVFLGEKLQLINYARV